MAGYADRSSKRDQDSAEDVSAAGHRQVHRGRQREGLVNHRKESQCLSRLTLVLHDAASGITVVSEAIIVIY